MMEHIYRDRVGRWGAALRRGDGTVQHCGMVFRPSVFFCVENPGLTPDSDTRARQREVTGVTAACMLIRRSVFPGGGRIRRGQLPHRFSDADLCLRIRRAGYRDHLYAVRGAGSPRVPDAPSSREEAYEMYTLFQRNIGDTPMYDRHYTRCFRAEYVWILSGIWISLM